MGSSTLVHAGLFQELADAARASAGTRAAIVSRLDHATMTAYPVAVALGIPGTRSGRSGFNAPLSAGAHSGLRRVYLRGRPLSVPLRALFDALRAGWATVLPLRTRRGVAGSLILADARRPTASRLRRYEAIARLIAPVFQLSEDTRQYAGANERTRREAAAVLHGTQAALLAIRYRLGESRDLLTADPSRAASILEAAGGELERISERDIARTSRVLFPLALRMSLTPALEGLADRFKPGVHVGLRIHNAVARMDDPLENRLPVALRLAVYRMVEAAVAGAAERGAKHVDVSVRRTRGPDLVVTVRERSSGRTQAVQGRDAEDLLLPLHEWGGTLTLSTPRSGGTMLSASFPLPATPAHPAG